MIRRWGGSSRDPLGRAPLMGLPGQPYVYADNNPLKNVDPSGQYMVDMEGHREGYLQYGSGGARIHFIPPETQKPHGPDIWTHGHTYSQPDALAYALSAAGLGIAFKQENTAAAGKLIEQAIDDIMRHHRRPGSRGWTRYLEALDERATNQSWAEMLDKMSYILIGAAFVLDAVQYAFTYYGAYHTDDPDNTNRLARSVFAGVIHAFITIGSSVVGAAIVGLIATACGIEVPFIPEAIGGFLGGLAGGWMADQATPHIVDGFISTLNPEPY